MGIRISRSISGRDSILVSIVISQPGGGSVLDKWVQIMRDWGVKQSVKFIIKKPTFS